MEKVYVLGSEAINVNLFLSIYLALMNKMRFIPRCVDKPGLSPMQPKVCNEKMKRIGSVEISAKRQEGGL